MPAREAAPCWSWTFFPHPHYPLPVPACPLPALPFTTCPLACLCPACLLPIPFPLYLPLCPPLLPALAPTPTPCLALFLHTDRLPAWCMILMLFGSLWTVCLVETGPLGLGALPSHQDSSFKDLKLSLMCGSILIGSNLVPGEDIRPQIITFPGCHSGTLLHY